MNQLQILNDAGLGVALSEVNREKHGTCRATHAHFHIKNGWLFCPHCGEELKIQTVCETCGRHFMTMRSFKMHLQFGHSKPCPKCSKVSKQKPPFIGLRLPTKHRRFFRVCAGCDVIFSNRDGSIISPRYSALFLSAVGKGNSRQ